jgi:hypothetical protein
MTSRGGRGGVERLWVRHGSGRIIAIKEEILDESFWSLHPFVEGVSNAGSEVSGSKQSFILGHGSDGI